MNIALLITPRNTSSLSGLRRWWASCRSRVPRLAVVPLQPAQTCAPKLVACFAASNGVDGQIVAKKRPLRVVRVVETGLSRGSVGRMVISGRMADVCAELDRLAAREAMAS